MNYYLIGLPGVGKSYWGKKLAELLSQSFIDLDLLIESDYKKSIPKIFELEGESTFRAIEAQILRQAIADNHNFIMSCGGGTPCFHENLTTMMTSGKVIYLKANPDTITKNLLLKYEEVHNRPLLKGSAIDLTDKLNKLLKIRTSYYEKADYIIDVNRPNHIIQNELESLLKGSPKS